MRTKYFSIDAKDKIENGYIKLGSGNEINLIVSKDLYSSTAELVEIRSSKGKENQYTIEHCYELEGSSYASNHKRKQEVYNTCSLKDVIELEDSILFSFSYGRRISI